MTIRKQVNQKDTTFHKYWCSTPCKIVFW